MQEVKLFIESKDQLNIEHRILDALKISDNFTSNHRIMRFEAKGVAEVELDQDGEDIHILCPTCGHYESQTVDQQRHHLQSFGIIGWLAEVNKVERSLMECGECSNKFVQLWDYKDQEDKIWNYNCSSNVVWGSFDYGQVVAKSEEEAISKAKLKVAKEIEEINNRLEGLGTISINLDELVVKLAG